MTQTRMTTRLPTALADALATRAEANHRSVNGELCAILQAALSGTPEQLKPTNCPGCGAAHSKTHARSCPEQAKQHAMYLSVLGEYGFTAEEMAWLDESPTAKAMEFAFYAGLRNR